MRSGSDTFLPACLSNKTLGIEITITARIVSLQPGIATKTFPKNLGRDSTWRSDTVWVNRIKKVTAKYKYPNHTATRRPANAIDWSHRGQLAQFLPPR